MRQTAFNRSEFNLLPSCMAQKRRKWSTPTEEGLSFNRLKSGLKVCHSMLIRRHCLKTALLVTSLAQMDDPFKMSAEDVITAGRCYNIQVSLSVVTPKDLVASFRHGLRALQWSTCLPKQRLVAHAPSTESFEVWQRRASLFAIPATDFQHLPSKLLRMQYIRHLLAEKIVANRGEPLKAQAFGPTGLETYEYQEHHFLPSLSALRELIYIISSSCASRCKPIFHYCRKETRARGLHHCRR